MTSRRAFLGGVLGSALAGAAAAEADARPATQDFVLVHDTWHGGRLWRDVARRLRAAGRRVITPTCTGCGEREHLATPATGLDTHITDVEQTIRFAEFERFVHVERLRRLITTHPAKQWTDELVVENGGWEGLSRAYLHCVGQKYRMSSDEMVGPARGSGWDFVEIDTPRNGMMTHPDLVTDTLLGLA